MNRLNSPNPFKPQRPIKWLVAAVLCLSLVRAFAQSSPAPTAPGAPGAPDSVTLPTITALQWSELDPSQQRALHPLQNHWGELSDVQRRKWVAIVKNFSKLTSTDQAKIQERMATWASLKPIERERARENFANSKIAEPATKMGSWEEYQALPQEEREKLASLASKKRPSAAKTPKPVAKTPTAPVPPPPPHPFPSTAERGELRNLITPNTLLPIVRQ
ncbi:MAG: DUF3106 domain-containing protein [Rhodoferax sp.]|nr:MAG: DUF3106 domain-containing protein [Rhodoferax sp.]